LFETGKEKTVAGTEKRKSSSKQSPSRSADLLAEKTQAKLRSNITKVLLKKETRSVQSLKKKK